MNKYYAICGTVHYDESHEQWCSSCKIIKLQQALTKIKSHNGCIAVIRRIAEDALKEMEG
jgi:hypothetical protein